jgi:hypothetical protein
MKLLLELVDGTVHTFVTKPTVETFSGAIVIATREEGFLNEVEFFPMENVKRVSIQR